MATPSLQQKKCRQLEFSLNLDLSLGGLFSWPKIPCEIKFPEIPSEMTYSESFSSHNSVATASCNNGEEQAPLLPSRHSSNKDNPVWDSLGSAAPSSSTHIQNPQQFVDCRMDGCMHSQRRHHSVLKRRKGWESEEIRQQKGARKEEHSCKDHGSSSLCNSSVTHSGNLHKANSLPIGYHEHSSLQLDRNMRGFDVDSMPCNGSHHRLSDMKKAMRTEVALPRPNQEAPFSEEAPAVLFTHSPTVSCISCVTPSCTPSSYSPTQKPSSPSTSSLPLITPSLLSSSAPTLETGSNGIINHVRPTKRKSSIEDEEGKICHSSSSGLENAPWSRCGNSDIIGSTGPSAAILPSASSIMYTHPFAMLPVQGPFSMPIQWGYTLPYAMHYSHGMMPTLAPEIKKSFISPLISSSFVPNIHLPENTSIPCIPFVPASAAGTSQPGVQTASCNEDKLQDNQETSSEEDALTCRLALSTPPSAKNAKLQPLSQIEELTPAMVHETITRSVSDVCASAAASSSWPLSSTSPTANFSSEVCTSSSWPLMSSTSPTASYSSGSRVEVDPPKPGPVNEVCKMGKSCKSQLAKKMLTSAFCSHVRPNGGIANRTAQEREQDDGSAGTQITSDQGESTSFKVERSGKLEGKKGANLPRVSTTCSGPNGKTIYGVMYIRKSKQVCLICSCHGTHMSPSEFVQHSGSKDLRNPERSIVVTGFSCVKQVV